MKKRLFILLTVCSLLNLSTVYGQQDAQFSQYMFNGLFLNPGYAGIEGVTRFNLINRIQWLAYEPTEGGGSAPFSTILSATTKLPQKFGGVGAYMLYDKLGPLQNIDIQLSYSYHLKIKDGTLGIGLRGGFFSQRVTNNFYRVVDQTDPVYQYFLRNGNVSQLKPDATAGLWYQTKKYYLGASFTHIPQQKYTLGFDSITSKLVNHMYITGGYNIQVTPSILVAPSALVQSDLKQWTYLFGALAYYNNKIWAGLNFRQSFAQREASKKGKTLSNDDIVLYVGLYILKDKKGNDAMRLGYSFDFVTSGVIAKKRTSHEIMVSYMLPPLGGQPKPKVRTPRYRHEEN